MPSVARLGDVCTGHGCWPPRPNVQGSPNVLTNGIPTHRQGDAWASHTCPAIPETHAGSLAGGSSTVMCNGSPIGRVGDPVSCGGVDASGSGNVIAGG